MNQQLAAITVVFLFRTNADEYGFATTSIKINEFYYIDKPPLIYDTSFDAEWDASQTIGTSGSYVGDIQKLPTAIQKQLEDNRFVNYTFYNIKRSNVSNIESDLKAITEELSKKWPIKMSYYKLNPDNKVLLDIMSISFYNLTDVIPIFNCKKAKGVGMNIMLTNSEVNSNKIMSNGYGLLFGFIFGKYKENIYTLDGEAIYRPYGQPADEVIRYICKLLKQHCPQDKKVYDKVTKDRRKKEE